jgi:hypothetical protein
VTNIHRRDELYQHSLVSLAATGVICGFGPCMATRWRSAPWPTSWPPCQPERLVPFNPFSSTTIHDRRQHHEPSIDRRALLRTGAALAAGAALPAWAQAQPTLRFAAVFSDKDIRAEMMKMFAKDVEPPTSRSSMHLNSTLFRQGTELVALQRDNLEMGNIAPQDISKQVPAWSLLTSAYLFRDANHLNAFFASELGAQMKKMVEDQLKVKILGPTFFGTRHVGLKGKKKINVPADLAGVKLRMPPGDTWQMLGRRSAPTPRPWPMPRPTPGCRPAPSTARTTRCPTCRT